MKRCHLFVPMLLLACSEKSGEPPGEPETPTNRIELPPEAVANLGITFAKAQRGGLRPTLPVPGRLEVPDDSQWTLRAPAAGRARVDTRRWDAVEPGQVLAEVVSPDLLEVQQALFEAQALERTAASELAGLRAELEPLKNHAGALRQAVQRSQQRLGQREEQLAAAQSLEDELARRVERLQALQDGTALSNRELLLARQEHAAAVDRSLDVTKDRDELQTAIAELELDAARAAAQVVAASIRQTILEDRERAARLAFAQRLAELAALVGTAEEALLEGDEIPRWQGLEAIPLRAPAAARVTRVVAASGEWLSAGDPVIELVDATELVFRGELPEGDLARLPQEAEVRVEPATGTPPLMSRMRGPLPLADPVARTLRLEAPVPNEALLLPAGCSAVAHVLLRSEETEEVLVPESSVVRSGLQRIVFRRDPEDRDVVVRVPVELGQRADGMVEVIAGLLDGDEVVLDGAYQLAQLDSGASLMGGHIHADGTFHKDH